MSAELTTLGEYVKIQGGYAFKSSDFSDNGTCPVLKIKNVRFGSVDYAETSFISEEVAQKAADWKTKEGDILISMTGSGPNAPQSLVGRVARIWENEPDSWINQRVGRVVLKDKKKIHPDFIFYLLSSPRSQDYLVSNSSGSANQANISGKIIESLPCPKIDYDQSAEIAKILRDLDQKILINNKINQSLEAMSQVIFKSWFVDFSPTRAKIKAKENAQDPELAAMAVISGKEVDELGTLGGREIEVLKSTAALFPTELVNSDLGEIPKGWAVKTVGDVCETTDYVANGSFKALKDNVTLYDAPNEVLYVRTTDFNKGFSNGLKYTDMSSYRFLKKSKLFGRETIISNVGDVGTVFRAPSWFDLPMTLGSNAVSLISEEYSGYLFWLFRSNGGQSLLRGIVTGSAQLKFNKTNLRSLEVLWPSEEVLKAFEVLELSFHEKVNSVKKQSTKLEKLRDSLLSNFLSGTLEVASAN